MNQPKGNLIGKKYTCEQCESIVICVKKGDGELHCHGAPMTIVTTKPLPSSD